MRKLALVITIAMLSTIAMADGYYRHDHYHYNRGGGGNNWAAPLIGGMILGGIIGSMNQRPYYTDVEPNPYYQPVCQQVFAGYDYYGRPRFRVICN